MEKEWLTHFHTESQMVVMNNIYYHIPDFENHFNKLVNDWEKQKAVKKDVKDVPKVQEFPKPKAKKVSKRDEETHSEAESEPNNSATKDVKEAEVSDNKDVSVGGNQDATFQSDSEGGSQTEERKLTAKERLQAKLNKGKKSKPDSTTQSNIMDSNLLGADSNKNIKGKKNTVRDINKNITKKEMDSLDFSSRTSKMTESKIDHSLFEGDFKPEMDVSFSLESDDEEDNTKKENVRTGGLLSRFTNTIKSFTGNKVMTEEDLIPVLTKFKEDLMGKNVAEEIARKICDSIKEKILNKKTESFSSITKTVKKVFEET